MEAGDAACVEHPSPRIHTMRPIFHSITLDLSPLESAPEEEGGAGYGCCAVCGCLGQVCGGRDEAVFKFDFQGKYQSMR